jgi:diguanylate cyclase (GGDEF)-like protein
MKKKSKNIRRVVLLSLILFITFSVVFVSVAYADQTRTYEEYKERVISDEKMVLLGQKSIMSDELYGRAADLLYLKDVYNLYQNEDNDNEDVKVLWSDFSARQKVYDQIRYIDAQGDEKIRINYDNGACIPVAESDLQNKSDRYYFKDTMALEDGQIYFSKLDLNIESDQIEDKPMIRLSTPVYSAEGEIEGMVIVNYNAAYLLKYFADIAATARGEVYLLNPDGYFIYDQQDPDKEWAFMYEGSEGIGFFSEFPDAWTHMNNSADGILWTDNGLFIYTTIGLLEGSGNYDFIVPGESIVLGEGKLIAVSYIPSGTENGAIFANSIWENILLIVRNNLFAIFALLALSIFLAIIIVSRVAANKRTKYYSEYDIMTGVMNRRAGLELLNRAYSRAAENDEKLSICYADVNGLKDVNDHIGHEAGDALIESVVDVFKRHIRQTDFIVRLGGDEFLIVLRQTGTQNAESVWERIAGEFEKINQTEGRGYQISVSHGIMSFTFRPDEDIDDVINTADQMMYEEKRQAKKDLNVFKDGRQS